jgi:hypothetical protein
MKEAFEITKDTSIEEYEWKVFQFIHDHGTLRSMQSLTRSTYYAPSNTTCLLDPFQKLSPYPRITMNQCKCNISNAVNMHPEF